MNIKTCFVFTLLALPFSASAGSVRSMSADYDVTGPDGETYTVSEIDCSNRSADRSIWRKASGGEWCGRAVEGFCSSNKIGAAKKVCDKPYDRALEQVTAEAQAVTETSQKEVAPPEADPETKGKGPSKEAIPAAASSTPEPTQPAGVDAGQGAQDIDEQKEQLAIERERLRLKKERLELRRQEMELQKQELEIQRQMEADNKANHETEAKAVEPAVNTEKGPRKSVLGM